MTRGRKRPIVVMKTKAAGRSRPRDNQAIAPLNQPNQIMFPKLSKPRAEVLAAFRFGVGMEEYCEDLARSVINALPRKKPVTVRVDETSLRDRLKAMVASVACEGRAVRGGDDDVSSDSVADGPGRDNS